MTVNLEQVTTALRHHLPQVMRWSGAVAKRLRQFNVALEGKTSGSSNTDALTLADLSVQELLVAGLRDCDPIFLQCRIEGEEETGDLHLFAEDGEYTISIDPIDGTKQYRDHTGNGWAVMLHLRSKQTVHYSLVYIPETGEQGTWVEAVGDEVRCGPDDISRTAGDAIASLPVKQHTDGFSSKKIYMIGFQDHDPAKAELVTQAGLEGVVADKTPGSIYQLMADGIFGGSLIHSPNVYDFPVSLHIARIFGGDALWVHNREPVNFEESWNDERADMLRLPGIVACSPNRETLNTLCEVAADWNPVRYAE